MHCIARFFQNHARSCMINFSRLRQISIFGQVFRCDIAVDQAEAPDGNWNVQTYKEEKCRCPVFVRSPDFMFRSGIERIMPLLSSSHAFIFSWDILGSVCGTSTWMNFLKTEKKTNVFCTNLY